MKAPRVPVRRVIRAPHLPLSELETILGDVTEMLGRIPQTQQHTLHVGALDGRIVQCRTAIAACRRHEFSPTLLRALSAKVLELETDALVFRRTVRVPSRAPQPQAPEPARSDRRPRRSRKRSA